MPPKKHRKKSTNSEKTRSRKKIKTEQQEDQVQTEEARAQAEAEEARSSNRTRILLNEMDEQMRNFIEGVDALHDQKALMFAEIASLVESLIHADNAHKFEKALGEKRESLVGELNEDLKRLMNGLSVNTESWFKLDHSASKAKRKSYLKVQASQVQDYVKSNGVSFVETRPAMREGDFYGELKWKNDLSSFQCLRYIDRMILRRRIEPVKSFMFCGQRLQVKHDPSQVNSHGKHHYLFELLGADNQIRVTVPVRLAHDIFTAWSAFYPFGSRLLLVTSFHKISTNLIYKMLKKLDTKRELMETKPSKDYNSAYFALFNRDFKLVKEFVMCENRAVGYYSFAVDLLNEQGILISKKFRYARTGQNYIQNNKKLVSFYDYEFKPIFEDFELPETEKSSHVVRVVDKQLYLVKFYCSDEEKLRLTVLNMEDNSVVKSSYVDKRKNYYIPPSKIMMDSKDNLLIVTRAHFSRDPYAKTHGYFISCVSTETGEWHEYDMSSISVFHRGCHLNEKDELVVFSQGFNAKELRAITVRF